MSVVKAAIYPIAVFGTGTIGTRHLQIFSGLESVQTVAIPVRAQRLVSLKTQGQQAVATLDEAVAAGARACVIATDTGRHAEDTCAAVTRGLDVLVEKPLAVTADDARRVVACAQASQRRLFVACVLRFSESLNCFRALLPSIGPVHAVRIECQSYLPDWRPQRPYQDTYSARPGEGGVLLDLIHEIDYAGWLFGWPQRVQATLSNTGRLGIAAEDAADLFWEAPMAGMVSIRVDYLSQPSRRMIRADGTQGTLEWDGLAGIVTCAARDAVAQVVRCSQSREQMFFDQAKAFLTACEASADARLATGEDGVKALAVCDAARSASRRQAMEPVRYL